MRGNGWQITAIISIVLVVLLIVSIVILSRDYQTRVDNEKSAQDAARAAAQQAATAEGQVKTLTELIGRPDAATVDEQQKLFADTVERVLPGENGSVRTYHDAVLAMLGDLEREREAHRRTSDARAQLQSDFNDARRQHESVVAQRREDLRRVEEARTAEQRAVAAMRAELATQLDEVHTEQKRRLDTTIAERQGLERELQSVKRENHDILGANTTLSEMLVQIRNPDIEYPAGKILSVDQNAGSAIINLGSADGLLVRTMFSVYHSGITGLSFRTAPVGSDAVYCDVCIREVTRDVSKASVEVLQILGPHRAQVRILDDILTDPIMAGDIIYSPIWKPGQKLRFALTGGLHLPGASLDSGTETVKQLIEMNGGVVDYWINEGANPDEEIEFGELSDLTNFVVVDDRGTRTVTNEVAVLNRSLRASARNRAVKVISLEDLLSRMAWRNMTPVDTFGDLGFTSEMRVIPQHQGSVRQSPGTITPLFTPDNLESRVKSGDAVPIRTSPGIVTPLFDGSAPSSPESSGSTSGLFRPRSPQEGQN